MTDTEKKLLQAQHRLEEAQARDRVKERKARTRRLIQEGAILEKVLPEVQAIELSELGVPFTEAGKTNLNFRWEASGKPGASLFFLPKGALTHHPEGAVVLAVGKPCALRGGLRLLRQPPDNATAPMGAAVIVCADGKFPATSAENWGRNSLPYVAACLRKPATGSFAAEMDGRSARPFSLCERETEKRNEVNERWQFTIWKQKWSAGAQAAPLWPLPLI